MSCADDDYVERGLENAAQERGTRVRPLDLPSRFAVEVLYEEDVERADRMAAA